ncbi:hypothetical protein SISSUDRAFT_1048902 [Sistotremastrum suecicum HHB10207 ss-3]|uniref:Pentacotripeptide-repeat region of PRORP domain-containing protein n=1 Tax=Sistotremastrum suecicum HHB10207 ss-3 TaxID=1314776 RepID=A0A166C713_9AGAM|nr:hypothetical protein SISSUDRAFT_1048902 [Sistotremastrum suecicum HHB10207 ss-3]
MHILPQPLIELCLAKSRLHANHVAAIANRRSVHALVSKVQKKQRPTRLHVERCDPSIVGPIQIHKTLSEGTNNVSTELERKLDKLKEIASIEEPELLDIPTYSEDDLASLYQDILSLTAVEQSHEPLKPQRTRVSTNDIVSLLLERFTGESSNSHNDAAQALGTLVEHLSTAINEILDLNEVARDHGSPTTLAQSLVPIKLLTGAEWLNLVYACIDLCKPQPAEKLLDLMNKMNDIPAEIVDESSEVVLRFYANQADVENAENFVKQFCPGLERPIERELLNLAYFKHGKVEAARRHLHALELRGIPAPESSYHRAISALLNPTASNTDLSKPISLARSVAAAWDLFAHMRYVAHPEINTEFYALMITACAGKIKGGSAPEPERALDLFTEATVDRKLQPTADLYNAVILACARSKKYAFEAFRLAKQMLDGNRDASGENAHWLRPTKNTFLALLEATKRLGDLSRARWILAELIREDARRWSEVQSQIRDGELPAEASWSPMLDEKVMNHVFHTYAAYRPPFQRADAPLVEQARNEPEVQESQVSHTDVSAPPSEERRVAPQSRSEVCQEADMLLQRITEDTSHSPDVSPEVYPKFSNVHLDATLLTSYLAVHLSHSSLSHCRQVFEHTWQTYSAQPVAYSFVCALERCANTKAKRDRTKALGWARELWIQWRERESRHTFAPTSNLEARHIERAWAAMIRIFALNDLTSEAMELVETFTRMYPPKDVAEPFAPKEPIDSNRVLLEGLRPLVRFSSITEIGDDTVPPMLTFRDVEVLHHRFVIEEDEKALGRLTYHCRSYQGAIRARKARTLKTQPMSPTPLSTPSILSLPPHGGEANVALLSHTPSL